MQIPPTTFDPTPLFGYLVGLLALGGNACQFILNRRQRKAETRRVDVDTVEKLTRMFNDLLDKGETRRAQYDVERDGFKSEIAVLEERIRVGEEERVTLKEENEACKTEMIDIKDRLRQLEIVRDTEPIHKDS